jgi:diamine N-acetyltransferase
MAMDLFRGELVYLRAIESSDATSILVWENNQKDWQVSGTEIPFSLQFILDHIETAQSFRLSGQLRLMMCDLDGNTVGLVDFFHANFKHHFVSIGILVAEEKRQLGYAKEAVGLALIYARKVFDFNNIFASIHATNSKSIALFEKLHFQRIGIRKNCYKFDDVFVDEVLLQLEIE